jgi:RHS repeat-associated protein
MVFGREKNLRLGEGSFPTPEDFFLGPGNRTKYVYDPYGAVTVYSATWTSPSAPVADGVLYCGYFLDAETGLYDVRYREYVTSVSTWAQRDPLEADKNLYRYCSSAPIETVDPTGCAAWTQELVSKPNFFGPNQYEETKDGTFVSRVGYEMVVKMTLPTTTVQKGAQTWQTSDVVAVMLAVTAGIPKWTPARQHKLDVKDLDAGRAKIEGTDTISLKIPSDGVCIAFLGEVVSRKLGFRPFEGGKFTQDALPPGLNYLATDEQWATAAKMGDPILASQITFGYVNWDTFRDLPKDEQAKVLKLYGAGADPTIGGSEWELTYSGFGRWSAFETNHL